MPSAGAPRTSSRGGGLRARALPLGIAAGCILTLLLSADPSRCETEDKEVPYRVQGDNLRARVVDGERVWELTGNVRIEHGTAVATSRRGTYWEERERLTLSDSVVVVDGGMVLTTEDAVYENDVVEAWDGVRIVDGEATIRSRWGRYLVGEKRAILVDGVEYSEAGTWVRADSLDYRREDDVFDAAGNVRIKDDRANLEGSGGILNFDRRTRTGLLTETPVLLVWGETGAPPIHITGLRMTLDADQERAAAAGDVEITRKEMTARCDSAVFFNREDRAVLTGSPVVEEGRRRITGERMEVGIREGEIRRLVVVGNAVGEWTREDSLSIGRPKTSRLSGGRIKFFFREEELTKVIVLDHARSVFYPEESKRVDERNTVEGDRMTLTVEDDEFNRALVQGNGTGSYVYAAEAPEVPGDSLAYETVDYLADEIEYFLPDDLIRMEGNAEVQYGRTRLKAGRIEFDSEEEWMLATRQPVLWEAQDRIDGHRMTYNLEGQHGSIFEGRTTYDKGFYTGRRIRKVGEEELNADWGVYTSCEEKEPHYSFRARRMKLYLKDKVVARPLVLYVRDIPILALPYYVFPIKPGRHSGLLIPNFEPGISKDKGRFIKNLGYYWAINDYSDLALWGDYYENTQWTGHFRGRYKVRYLLSGQAEGSYTSYPSVGGIKKRRWDLRASHGQQITDQLSLKAQADFVSDETYRVEANDIDQSYLDRINRELKSSLALSQRWSDRSLSLSLNRKQFLDINETDTRDDTEIVQTVPNLSFKVFRRRLWEPPPGKEDEAAWYQTIYYDVSSNLSRNQTLKEYGESVDQSVSGSLSLSSQKIPGSPSISFSTKAVDTRDEVFSLDRSVDSTSGEYVVTAERTTDEERWASRSTVGVRVTPKIRGWLDVRPAFNYEFTLFDHDKLGNRCAKLHTWSSSVGVGTTLYGTFLPEWGRLVGVRHVVKPSATWTYRPKFDQYEPGDYDRIGGIGVPSLGGQSALSLGLSHMFHLKVRDGEEVKKLDNVVQLSSSTSYDFRYRENNRKHPFSLLSSSLVIQPARSFDVRFQTTHDLHEKRVKSTSFTSSLKLTGQGFRIGPGAGRIESMMERNALEESERHLEERQERTAPTGAAQAGAPPLAPLEPWTLSLSYRYSKSSPGAEPTQWLNADLETHLSHSWRLSYGNRYDLSEKEIAYQSFTLYRDLHCWEARVSGEYSNEQWTYYFKINIKAHPELYIERGERRIGGGYYGGGYY